MAFPLIPLLIGAAAGGVKHFASDKPRADAQRRANAAMTRYSPWTGMKGDVVGEPDLFGTMLSTGLTGAAMGQMMGGAETAADTGSAWTQMGKGANKYGLGVDTTLAEPSWMKRYFGNGGY